VKSEYHAGMDAGEAVIICEVERLAIAAETEHEKNILYSLLNHLSLNFPDREED
jgi:ribosomal protein L13